MSAAIERAAWEVAKVAMERGLLASMPRHLRVLAHAHVRKALTGIAGSGLAPAPGPSRSGVRNGPPDPDVYGGHIGRDFLSLPMEEREQHVRDRMQEQITDLNAVFGLASAFATRPPVNEPVVSRAPIVVASRDRLNAGQPRSPKLDTVRPYLRRD